jgi:signal transduction histidine kinase
MRRAGDGRRLGLRVTLLFACVFAIATGLTDALLIVNAAGVQTDAGFTLLRRRAETAARILSAAGPATMEERRRLLALLDGDGFEAWALRDPAGVVIGEQGLAALGLSAADLPGPDEPSGGRMVRKNAAAVWMAWRPIASDDGMSAGSVVLASALGQSAAATRAFIVQLLFVSLLAAVVGFWTMLGIGAAVTRPIVGLTAAAARLAEGRLDTRTGIRRTDELGGLAAAFDGMAARLQENEEARRRFLADAAHELKTPLASMKALVEAVHPGEDDAEEMRASLTLVDREIDRLAGLVRSLLARSRLDSVAPSRSRIALRPAVARVAELLAAAAAEREAVIDNRVPDDAAVIADPSMLSELLLNLMDNAVRHGGGTARMTVSFTTGPDRGLLEVANTGPTIPAGALPRLFEPFFTVESSRSRPGSGTGLGLAIVARIAEAHGWTVHAHSADGLTRFTVVMPAEAGPGGEGRQ